MNIETSQIQERILFFLRENILFTVLFMSGIALFIIGIIPKEKKEEIQLVREETLSAPSSIYIDVSGAVLTPGLYKLNNGSRIQDAIVAAGGFSEEADREYISEYLNLAQKLNDGAKLFIPKENSSATQFGSVAGQSTTSLLVNINNASESELDTLPAIGEVTAEKIVKSRPYQEIGDLVTKKVIGQKTYDKIKDLISVY